MLVEEQVIIEKVIELSLEEENRTWDAFVLDQNMVAVRTNDANFKFF